MRSKRYLLLAELDPRLLRFERQERLGIETDDTEAWYLAALSTLKTYETYHNKKAFRLSLIGLKPRLRTPCSVKDIKFYELEIGMAK